MFLMQIYSLMLKFLEADKAKLTFSYNTWISIPNLPHYH